MARSRAPGPSRKPATAVSIASAKPSNPTVAIAVNSPVTLPKWCEGADGD